MIQRPPRSTLFPTRRSSDLREGFRRRRLPLDQPRRLGAERARSEEHTSELQSQSNLVCRLLLEKKKADEVLHTVIWRNWYVKNFDNPNEAIKYCDEFRSLDV